MPRGFKPRIISQIFAPVPAARSRCLSSFVAIARHNLPIPMRYEPSHLLGFVGLAFLLAGFVTDTVTRVGAMFVGVGWGCLGLALVAMLCQDRLTYGQTRWRLIRQLDEVRRSTGLDNAILPESLEFLEATAQHWERIEHALQSHVWRDQQTLKQRIELAAHRVMEDIVVIECGSVGEAGIPDQEAHEALSGRAAYLVQLADQVDATGAAITTYPRMNFESSGVDAHGAIPELEELEAALSRLA